jgi:excisionase family DNA binding protein
VRVTHEQRFGKVEKAAKDTMAGDDRLINVREAAQLLGMKVKTLYEWSHERRIPVVKLYGRSLRFRLSTILKLIADSERPALRAEPAGED